MVLLLVIIVVFAIMNRELLRGSRQALENAEIVLKYDSSEAVLSFGDLLELEEKDFTAIFDSSNIDPVEHSYTGVALYNIFESLDMDLNNIEQVIVRGADGYTVAFSPQEVLDNDNIYLAYKFNDKPLKHKGRGGSGPYQIVVRKDQFSQRWCKFVVEIELK